jgi:hypothetical protein
MGASLAYLVVQGKSKEKIWEELGLKLSQSQERPAFSRKVIEGVLTKSGGYLICDYSWKVFDEEKLIKLSTNAELFAGEVDERVNISMASGWKDGVNTWSVRHDLDEGRTHLNVVGDPPEPFSQIKHTIFEQRKRELDCCDFIFDIPVDLFKALTGFSYDGTGDIGARFEPAYDYLERIRDENCKPISDIETLPMEKLFGVLSRLGCSVQMEKNGEVVIDRRFGVGPSFRLGLYKPNSDVSSKTIQALLKEMDITFDAWLNEINEIA